MLTALNDTTRKILTIEDPVEYEIRGVNQSQVKPEIGLTFATALRAFVRQDPDVIMVGEVRDPETANIAIHAALTGHLVLTTLHTETAATAVPRLLDLGVENFLLQSTLRAVIAQRLVRVLCERCKTATAALCSEEIAADPRYPMLGLKVGDCVHEPKGCERCNGTGYRGRTGVFEVLEITDDVRELMQSKPDAGAITRAATDAGMTTMFEDAAAKCRAGVTSAAEVFRVTTAGDEVMPNFRYRALTETGEIVSGLITAPTSAEVARRIDYLRLVPVDPIVEEGATRASHLSFKF